MSVFEFVDQVRTLARDSGKIAAVNALVYAGLNLPDAIVFYDVWIREEAGWG